MRNFSNHDHDDREDTEYEEVQHKKRKKPMNLVMAHFNPKELEVLDREQGGRTVVPGTKTPHYKKIEIMISSPGGEESFRKALEHHAAGGFVGESRRKIEDLKRKGRFGDTEIAYIGPNTHRIFDKAVKDLSGNQRENKNPHTGHPEYYGLSNFFGGIKKGIGNLGGTINRGMNTAGKFAGNIAREVPQFMQQAAPGMLQGGLEGMLAGGPEGALMGAGMGAMGGMGSHLMDPNNTGPLNQQAQQLAQNPTFNQIAGAGAAAYDRNQQGQNWRDNMSSAVNQGTQGMNNSYARALNSGANAYDRNQQGQDWRSNLAAGLQQGTQGMDNRYARALNNGASSYQNPYQPQGYGNY